MATFSSYINPSSAYQLVLECIVKSQSIENNTSTVQFIGTINRINSAYGAYNTTSSNTVNFGDGYEYPTTGYDLMNGYSTQIFNFEKTLKHDSYGRWSKWVQWDFNGNISSYNPYGPVGGILTLPTIPRASSVVCPDFNIGSSTVININRANSSFTHTLIYRFGNLSETIVTKTSDVTIGWTAPTSFYDQIPNDKRGIGTITCHTYNGNELIGTSTCNFYAHVVDSNPIVSTSIVDTNSKTINLTGNENVLIKYMSNAKVSIIATAQNSSTIKSYSIKCDDGKSSTLQEATLNVIESNVFRCSATDSRGFTTQKVSTLSMVEYVKLVFKNYSFERLSQTSSTVKLKYDGLWFNGNFGTKDNTLSLKYRSRISGIGEWSEYIQLLPSIENNTFSEELELDGEFDYQTQYDFELVAEDNLMTVSKEQVVIKGVATFEYGEHDVQVNGQLYIADEDRNNIKEIRDLIYPVGSIYMSVNAVNPSIFLGGTWEIWGNGRVPVGVDTTQEEFNTVEKTGGEKAHTLTIAEMPSHAHKYDMKPGNGGWTVVSMSDGAPAYQAETHAMGGNSPHNNLQPYITCYMWKRTA